MMFVPRTLGRLLRFSFAIALLACGLSARGVAQQIANVYLNPPTISPGLTSLATVYIDAPAPAGGLVVKLSSSTSDFSVPASVTVPAGTKSANFTVKAAPKAVSLTKIIASSATNARYGWIRAALDSYSISYERESINPAGTQANDDSGEPFTSYYGESRRLSGDGKTVVFSSKASNLVPGDTNRKCDVFSRDRLSGAITRISQTASGIQGNGDSYSPSISADGNWVAFVSTASNLVPGSVPGVQNVYLWNRATRKLTLVSANGKQAGNDDSAEPSVSRDGSFVAFASYATNLAPNHASGLSDIYLYSRKSNVVTPVSLGQDGTYGNGDSLRPSISGTGQFVAFDSDSDNLVPGDTNQCRDVFVRDTNSGKTTRVSLGTDNGELTGDSSSASICADGSKVAFATLSSLVVPFVPASSILVRNTVESWTSVTSQGLFGNYPGDQLKPTISADGHRVAFLSLGANLGSVQAIPSQAYVIVGTYEGKDFFGSSFLSGTPDYSLSGDGSLLTIQTGDRTLIPDNATDKLNLFVANVFPQYALIYPPFNFPSAYTGDYQNYAAVLAGSPVTFEVWTNQFAPPSGQRVSLSSSDPSVKLASSVTVAAGSKSAPVTVQTTGRTNSSTLFTLTAICASRSTSSPKVVVSPFLLTLDKTSVPPGGDVTGTVTLSKASKTDTKITLAVNNYPQLPDLLNFPDFVTIPKGSLAVSFTFTVSATAQGNGYYPSEYTLSAKSSLVSGLTIFGKVSVASPVRHR
jgi:WD40-like Beta Propeller Repeat